MKSSSAEQKFMTRLNEIIDANLHDEKFGVSELASELGMNRATLHRKVKAIVNQSVSSFIREARLKRAHQLLYEKAGTVSEIAYMVGFGSVPYFTRSFHKYFGYTPGEVLKGNHVCPEENPDKKLPFTKKQLQFFALVVLFVLVVFGIYYFMPPHFFRHSKAQIAIAVLPFESEDHPAIILKEANWIIIELIEKLERIEGISAVSYPVIKNYNYAKKNYRQIARELNTNFILYNDIIQSDEKVKISFNLINGSTGETEWSSIFQKYLDFENIGEDFKLQNDVAFQVVQNLKSRISNKQKAQIQEKITNNPIAYKNYKLAYYHLTRNNRNMVDILGAKSLLEQAVRIDSTFSEAYALIGQVYANNLWYTPVVKLAALYLDSAKTFYEKALAIDENNNRAIVGLWKYYRLCELNDQAKAFESRLPEQIINYNYYMSKFSDIDVVHPVEKLDAFYKYLELKPEDFITPWWMYHRVFYIYMSMGFPGLAKKYASEENLIVYTEPLPNNSFNYSLIQELNGNYDSALVYIKARYNENPGDVFNYLLLAARNSMRERNYNKASIYLDSMEIINKNWLVMLSSDSSRLLYPFGYSYIKTGQIQKGEYLLNRLVKKYETEIETHWTFARENRFSYLEIALTFSALGKVEKSLAYLNQLVEKGGCQLWFILEMKNNPMFDTIRETPEYNEIFQKLEKNYNREHERIKKLLISRGIEPA